MLRKAMLVQIRKSRNEEKPTWSEVEKSEIRNPEGVDCKSIRIKVERVFRAFVLCQGI